MRVLRFGLSVAAIAAVAVIAGLVLLVERGAAPASGAASAGPLAAVAVYQQSADPADRATAQRVTDAALRERAGDPEALEAAARIAASAHQFEDALELARRSSEAAPDRVGPIGVKADALIELGRYADGFAAADERLGRRPDLASYARASYVAELSGDLAAAREQMELASRSALPGSSSRAWSLLQLALLHLRTGDVGAAESVFNQMQVENPNNPEVVIGRARVAAARGRLDAAARHYAEGVELRPEPDHFAEEAEAALARGDRAAAEAAVERARAAFDRFAAFEDVELERAAFEADWTTPDEDAIVLARAARSRRPSVVGDSALAWVLTRAGRCEEASALATRSLRLGTRDPLALFRAGMAARCGGDEGLASARLRAAIAQAPAFSLRWAPVARRILAG